MSDKQEDQREKTRTCPICEGTGMIEAGVYDHSHGKGSTTTFKTCKVCGGKGVMPEKVAG